MREISSSDRRYLRGLANKLKPVAMVGKHGMSQSLIDSVNQALEAHELIKMKFIDHKGQKKEITAAVAERTGSAVAGIIGNVAILYREHEDKEKRTIDLDAPRL